MGTTTTTGRSRRRIGLLRALRRGRQRASAILVPTFTGRTASAVARLRPRRPIIALTHHEWSVQQMALEWGVTPVLMPQTENVEDLWTRSLEVAL